MLYIRPELRLRIEANLSDGSPLYVLGLEGLSVVAALRELSWHLAVTLGESFLDESEYATMLIEVLCPMAMTTRLLAPGTPWISHATLRLHTETKTIEDSDETKDVMMIEFSVDDLEFRHENLSSVAPSSRATLIEAYDEEVTIIRALAGFAGDGAALLNTLQLHMECGAILARRQLFQQSAQRAQMALHSLFIDDAVVRRRIDRFATWLMRLQAQVEESGDAFKSASVDVAYSGRIH